MSPLMWDVWERNAREQPGREAIVHWDAIEAPHAWTRSALLDSALRAGTWLADAGLDTGEVCALVLRHHRAFYPVYMGVSSLGAIPAVLAYPNPRLHPEKFAHGLLGMAERSGLDWIFTTRDLEPSIRPLVVHGKSSIKGIFLLEECERGGVIGPEPRPDLLERKRAAVRPSDPFLVQHSSGTTGLQKPVALSHTAVLDHVERYAEAIRLSEADKVASWLPLYHDMGLIAALHLPLALGVPLIQIDPFQWVTAPVLLFNVISEYGATLCWLPNFAYNFMADRIREEDMEGVRLDTVRMIINCSEPVRADSHDKFHARFSPFGLRRDSLAACYAMAETTFAATQTAPQEEAGKLCVDREAISRGIVARLAEVGARVCVSSGKPIPGCSLRIVDEDGNTLPEDRVGEIRISSASLFDGYRNYPEKTAEVLTDGWYATGDYGFLHGGDCYVIGRKKDIIISAGKNIYPEDVEDAVNQVEGVLPGRVVALGVEDPAEGTEHVCVVAETAVDGEPEKKRLRMNILRAGMGIDVTISRVHLVPPRWLIKSSAGKPSRKANRERVLAMAPNGSGDWTE